MQLINKKTLLGMIPLSEKAIYNMEKRGDFPKRIALTHSIVSETRNHSIGAGLLANFSNFPDFHDPSRDRAGKAAGSKNGGRHGKLRS